MILQGTTSSRLLLMAILLLSACQGTEQEPIVYTSAPPVVAPEPVAPVGPDYFLRARILADILYAAKVAYEDNRLMTPPGNNAYDRYLEVLEMDPGNAVAQEGIVEIVLRYVELADVAISQGQYDNAASLLRRGAGLMPERPELAQGRERLAVARENKVETFALDAGGLSSQSQEMQNKLAEIARYIRTQETTFLINARTDEEGRWIYKVMREAVDGYRLRGNIVIAGTPNILISAAPN